MAFNYVPPQQPQNPGPFAPQHGYNDIQVKTHKYDGNCKPINPTTHHVQGNFEKFAKNDNTKKAGNFLMQFLLKQCR